MKIQKYVIFIGLENRPAEIGGKLYHLDRVFVWEGDLGPYPD